jgi:L-alanine-DL-glutamate epimerase-like enolase superfamily enzyme
MAKLERIEAGFYRVPLPEVLTDSTHGAMRAFEIVTARVFDADGAEGVGYTFTVGRNGAAVDAVLAREIAEIAPGQDADLVLLDADPLADIRNLRAVSGVMLRGRWLPRAELDRMLRAASERIDDRD